MPRAWAKGATCCRGQGASLAAAVPGRLHCRHAAFAPPPSPDASAGLPGAAAVAGGAADQSLESGAGAGADVHECAGRQPGCRAAPPADDIGAARVASRRACGGDQSAPGRPRCRPPWRSLRLLRAGCKAVALVGAGGAVPVAVAADDDIHTRRRAAPGGAALGSAWRARATALRRPRPPRAFVSPLPLRRRCFGLRVRVWTKRPFLESSQRPPSCGGARLGAADKTTAQPTGRRGRRAQSVCTRCTRRFRAVPSTPPDQRSRRSVSRSPCRFGTAKACSCVGDC